MLSSRTLLAALIVAATALFAVGVTIERNTKDEHAEPAPAGATQQTDEQTHREREEGEHSEAEETHGENAASEEAAHSAEGETTSEELLGIDPESTSLIVLAVLASLALAAAVIRWPQQTRLLWLVAIAMVAFAALDLREVFHQIDESREGLTVLAGVVVLLHALAAAVSALQARRIPAA